MKKKAFQFLFLMLGLLGLGSGPLHAQKEDNDNGEKFRISLIMPFCAEELKNNPASKNASIGTACRRYYEGMSIALDSFKKSETPIEIRVYDTRRDSLTFKRILDKKEVQNSDFIIGPVLKEGNEMMTDFCAKNKIYHLSPFLTLTKSKIENPYLISAYPDLNYYSDYILEQIKLSGETDANIVVLSGKENNDKVLATRLMALKSKYPNYTFKSLDISKYTDYKSAYKLGKANKVIVFSENEFMVASTLRFLSDTTQFVDLEVFGLRKWLEFKSPNIPLMEHLQVKLVSPFYFDYTDPNCRLFIEKYRERYFTDPDEYAIAGYEQATFFLSELINYHGSFDKITVHGRNKPLSNWYCIRQKPEAKSLQNSLLNLLYFEEGRLRRY